MEGSRGRIHTPVCTGKYTTRCAVLKFFSLCSELFRHGWNFPIAVFVISVEGSLFYLLNNIWPSQVFALYAHDAVIAALYLLPFFMTILVISPFLSIYATRYKDVKWPIVAGFAFFLSAIIGYGTTTATSNKAAIA